MTRFIFIKPIACLCILLLTVPAFGYEVWIGTTHTPHNAAVMPETWSRVAAQVAGLNINLAGGNNTPGSTETPPTNSDWRKILGQYQNRNNGFVPIPRSAFGPAGPHAGKTITDLIDTRLAHASNFGYVMGNIMFYDNAVDGVNYNWTTGEVQAMRDYLDSTGNQHVGLICNARNNSQAVRNWCENPLVSAIVLEANPDKWLTNAGNRQTLLNWLWTNPETVNKRIIFQIPTTTDVYYQDIRRFLVWLSNDLMGPDFLANDRVVFLLVTYNSYTFYPETNPEGNAYTNTMTGTVLSLIEQRDLFEGQFGPPTNADADDIGRLPIFAGDVNQDGAVNFLDISPFISLLSSGEFLEEADINQDEAVNFLDISPFITLLSGQ